MGLFMTTCLHWIGMASTRWINLKDHFIKVYEAHFVTSAGLSAHHGYASNILAPGLPMPGRPVDNNNLNTIHSGFVSHTMTFNAQAQRYGDTIIDIRAAMMKM